MQKAKTLGRAKAEAKHNANLFIKIAVVVAFVGVSAIVAGIVFKANSEISSRSIADESGVPKVWTESSRANSIVASSSLSATIPNGGKYIQYTARVTNEDPEDSLYVTHLASYMISDGSDEDGYMKLSGESLEYSYTPNDDDSWKQIGLTRPSKSKEAFKLTEDLPISKAGSETNSVYFRFYIAPEDSQTNTINNTLSVGLRDDSGENGYITSGTMVAYQQKETPTIAVVSKDGSSENGVSSTYVQPLGESSYRPGIATVSGTIVNGEMDGNFLSVSIIVMVATVILFAICLAIYLPLRKY